MKCIIKAIIMTETILNWGQNQLEMVVHEYYYMQNGTY